MRTVTLGLATALMFGTGAVLMTPASAQTVEVGPGGSVGLDLRNSRQRERDYQREEVRRDREIERRRDARRRNEDDLTTGSTRCREVTVRERNEYGEMETRRTRDCR